MKQRRLAAADCVQLRGYPSPAAVAVLLHPRLTSDCGASAIPAAGASLVEPGCCLPCRARRCVALPPLPGVSAIPPLSPAGLTCCPLRRWPPGATPPQPHSAQTEADNLSSQPLLSPNLQSSRAHRIAMPAPQMACGCGTTPTRWNRRGPRTLRPWTPTSPSMWPGRGLTSWR